APRRGPRAAATAAAPAGGRSCRVRTGAAPRTLAAHGAVRARRLRARRPPERLGAPAQARTPSARPAGAAPSADEPLGAALDGGRPLARPVSPPVRAAPPHVRRALPPAPLREPAQA